MAEDVGAGAFGVVGRVVVVLSLLVMIGVLVLVSCFKWYWCGVGWW